MPASAPTGVAPTAVGRMVEQIARCEQIQEDPLRNENNAVVVQNLNIDRDTNIGTATIQWSIVNTVDPVTGALVETAVDPFKD